MSSSRSLKNAMAFDMRFHSGKSTQTPTMILEQLLSQGKHVKIYCTEPRRISAISLAQRVSQELGESPGVVGTSKSLIGYNIRLESRVSQNSRLIYATTVSLAWPVSTVNRRGCELTGRSMSSVGNSVAYA